MVARYWLTMVWLDGTVRAIALSQSLPTPNTHEPLRVVISDALGAPEAALALAVAPIAPEPPVPVASAPVKVTTVIEDVTPCDNVAVTLTLVSVEGAKARQISAVPNWALVRRTSVQVRPVPLTLVTVTPGEVASLEIKARSSSFAELVENDGEVMLELGAELFCDLT